MGSESTLEEEVGMIRILKDKEELSNAAADLIIETAVETIAHSGRFSIALTGGTSPERVYKLLATKEYASRVDWSRVFVFWGDERWVPLDDERSNAGMALNSLLKHVPVPSKQVFPMWNREREPEEFARNYEDMLRDQLGPDGQFDLVLLGMGEDGHTASLFPGMDVLTEKERWVVSYYLEAQDMFRVTLTAPLLNKAKKIMFLVYGAAKAEAMYEVLEGERNENKYPAQLIQPESKQVLWLADQLAASKLTV